MVYQSHPKIIGRSETREDWSDCVWKVEPRSDWEIERAYRKSTLKLRDLSQHARVEVYGNFETLNWSQTKQTNQHVRVKIYDLHNQWESMTFN
jgi:hypothetical protein